MSDAEMRSIFSMIAKNQNQKETGHSTQSKSINKVQILIGIAGLFAGTLVYLIDRPPDQTYFVSWSKITVGLFDAHPNVFGAVGNYLPDFLHVFSFILITAGLLACQKAGCIIICLSWFTVDFVFELFQKFNTVPLKIIPGWFKGIPFLENAESYFSRGTFDIFDLMAIATGSVIAYFILLTTYKGESWHDRKKEYI
jgi:hypothetical protein